jgi:hypothetical protein
MTGAGPVSLREIGRVKSAATRVALLPVVDLAGYTANTAFWQPIVKATGYKITN